MKLYQPTHGYRYNSDSLLLYYFASTYKPKGTLLDIGTGCGIVGLLLKQDFQIELTGLDLQQDFIKLAKKNAQMNNIKANFVCSDLKDFDQNAFDYLVSNPPFYKAETKKSENLSLSQARYANFLPLDLLFAKAFLLLKAKGALLLAYKADFLPQILKFAGLNKLFCCKITFVHSRATSKARLALLEFRKYQRQDLEITAPMIMNENFASSIAMKTNLESINDE